MGLNLQQSHDHRLNYGLRARHSEAARGGTVAGPNHRSVGRRGSALLEAPLLLDRPQRKRLRFETLVRDGFSALDRYAVSPGRDPALGERDADELLAEVRLEGNRDRLSLECGARVRRFSGLLPAERRVGPDLAALFGQQGFDSGPLSGYQFNRPLLVHDHFLIRSPGPRRVDASPAANR